MIGHQRLLDSISNFKYKEKHTSHSLTSIGEDRFIPNRKDL